MSSVSPDQLPALSDAYALDPSLVGAFRRDGHVTVRGLASEQEVAAYRSAIADAVKRLNEETRPLEERDTYGKAFLQTMNLWEFDEAVARFTLSPRFAGVAAELLGVDGLRLYHDQALFKEAGGGPTPWHQDQFYWPLDCPTITMWMALVDADSDMGTMNFASGSQAEGYLRAMKISDESEEYFDRFVQEKGYPVTPTGALRAGDATFHAGWVLHSAGPNTSGRMREAMTVIYFADGAQILKPDHQNRQDDLERWFPGQKPGEPAGSPINPIVFRRTAAREG